MQAVIQNKNSGTLASADLIVGGNLMTDSIYYGDLGYNSSGNTNPSYTGFGQNSLYLYNSDGEVSIATASSTNSNAVIKFLTGGTLAANERARFDLAGDFGLASTSPWARLSVNADASLYASPAFAVGSTSSTYFLINNGGKVGVGTTSPWAQFSINPTASLGSVPAFAVGSTTATLFSITGSIGGTGLFNYGARSTTTISNTAGYAWTIATSTDARPLISIDGSSGTNWSNRSRHRDW
jgi:hypothetical protein